MDEAAARKLHDAPPAADAAGPDAKPWGLLILLMAMTSIGPTSLNILVPALPQLSQKLGADIGTLQLTVSLFLVGLALAQLAMGPLSDRFGRRPVLLAGFALTGFASLLAIVMSTAESLIVARVLQAVGASTGIVVGRAIIRDLFDRNRAASVIGLVATVMVVVPTFGPLIGGLLDVAFGWQAIFGFTAVTSLGVLIWIAISLPETRGLNAPTGAPAAFWRDLAGLGRSARFAGYVLVAAFGSAPFFVFLGGGPYVVINLMGNSSAQFGLWFAFSSIGYMGGNFAASRLAVRFGVHKLIWWGIGFEIAGTVLQTLLVLLVPGLGAAIIFVPQVIVNFGNGLLLPAAISGATSVRPQAAGTAAGITGCLQMSLGAGLVQYSGTLLAGAGSALPLALLMDGVIAALALSFVLLAARR